MKTILVPRCRGLYGCVLIMGLLFFCDVCTFRRDEVNRNCRSIIKTNVYGFRWLMSVLAAIVCSSCIIYLQYGCQVCSSRNQIWIIQFRAHCRGNKKQCSRTEIVILRFVETSVYLFQITCLTECNWNLQLIILLVSRFKYINYFNH